MFNVSSAKGCRSSIAVKMKIISQEMFGDLVMKFFEPMARKAGFPLKRFSKESTTFSRSLAKRSFCGFGAGIGHNKIFFEFAFQFSSRPQRHRLLMKPAAQYSMTFEGALAHRNLGSYLRPVFRQLSPALFSLPLRRALSVQPGCRRCLHKPA